MFDGVYCELVISIHALRKESDPSPSFVSPCARKFQSTLSVRRATGISRHSVVRHGISIHALRKESDLLSSVVAGYQ